MKRIFGLDVLRAAAILCVLIFHGGLLFDPPYELSIFGFIGVEMFFVLSGFLIGGILIKEFEREYNINTIKVFWIRRWFRTLPNYFLFLFIHILNLYSQNHYYDTQEIIKHFLFLQNFAWKRSELYVISWSLAIEEWFYLSLPILLLIIYKLFIQNKKTAFLVTIVVTITTFTTIRCLYVSFFNPLWPWAVMRQIVVFRLDSLMYGVLAAFLAYYYQTLWERSRYFLATLGSILFSTVVYTYLQINLNDSYYARTFYFSVISLSIFCFLPILNNWRHSKGVLLTVVSSISIWSYSLYLSHPIAMKLVLSFNNKFFKGQLLLNVIMFFLFISLATFLSFICYKYFENPTTKLREKFIVNP